MREIICPCPSCGGQTIDQCHPGCEDGGELRALVKAQSGKGQDEQQILTALVADRGERILGNPRAQGFGIMAAAVPALALLLGLLPMGLVLRARRRSVPSPVATPVAQEEDPRVTAALRDVDF